VTSHDASAAAFVRPVINTFSIGVAMASKKAQRTNGEIKVSVRLPLDIL